MRQITYVIGRCLSSIRRHFASFPLPSSILASSIHSPMDMFTSVHTLELISPDEAAEVIVMALADPASVPLACIHILIYSYSVLSRLWTEQDNHRRVFRHYSHVLRCTMRFLCSFRSAEQFRVLKQTLERGPCRCARGPEALHKLIPPSRHRALLVPGVARIPHLICAMSAMLNSAILVHDGLQKLYKATRKRLWPTSMDDLVPDGSASFHNLVRWLPQTSEDTSQQAAYNMLVCNVFDAMPSYLRAGFIKGPMLVDWLHHTMTTWTMQPIDVHADLPRAMLYTGPLLESASNLSDDEIFLWLSGSPRHSSQDMFTALDHAFTMMMKYPSHAASYKQVRALEPSYRIILSHMVLAKHPILRLELSLYTSESDREMMRASRIDPVMRLARTAFGSNWHQRCYGTGCIATYADRSKDFKRCSGCRAATYCSRKCQNAAWRHPTAAHRKVCGLYRACEDAVLPHEDDINEAAVRAWGTLPREQLDAASANIENLRATQLVCLSTCSLLSDLLRYDLISLAEEEMDSIPTDEL
jgi:hypothetical protein